MAERFDRAIMLLPVSLRSEARRLTKNQRGKAEEIRLRKGYPMSIVFPHGETAISKEPVLSEQIDALIDIATGASAHAYRDSVREGYITAAGGIRIGLGGTAVMKDGEVQCYREISSAAIRIAREYKGIGEKVLAQIGEPFSSTLIISPPGWGKTTLLRDMIRLLSNGGTRVALADERGEVASMGIASRFDMGCRTDIIDGCPKSIAVLMLLRAMNPQVMALDEITHPKDIEAINEAANCGVELLATAHAGSVEDLSIRPMYRKLLEQGIFKNAVVIKRNENGRIFEVNKL